MLGLTLLCSFLSHLLVKMSSSIKDSLLDHIIIIARISLLSGEEMRDSREVLNAFENKRIVP